MERLTVVLLGHVFHSINYKFQFQYGLQREDGTYLRRRFWGAIQYTKHKWKATYWSKPEKAINWGTKHGYNIE